MTETVIKIGVCGHRHLPHLEHLEMGIRVAVKRIQAAYANANYQVYSCLAEGADRLLARRLVETLAADLIVILPLPEREYLQDFQTKESIQEYWNLKLLARQVITPAHEQARPQAYRVTNDYLVANCDLLLAIWDGEPARGPGGTGEIVEMFRQAGLPLLWINDDQTLDAGSLREERLERLV
jgi:hypothetical protein